MRSKVGSVLNASQHSRSLVFEDGACDHRSNYNYPWWKRRVILLSVKNQVEVLMSTKDEVKVSDQRTDSSCRLAFATPLIVLEKIIQAFGRILRSSAATSLSRGGT